ncbi:hypothetical protein KAI58_01595 [Candidatus Gracilibacteria bacterium]|nr:hypothetical protein [Candidatus Gracilibacteria bacterium]
MNQSIKIFGSALFGLWFLFLGQTFLKQQDKSIQIIGRENFLAVKSKTGLVFWWGEKNEVVLGELRPFFSKNTGLEMVFSEEEIAFSVGEVEIKKFSKDFVRGEFGKAKMFFIGEEFDSAQIKAQPLSLESDFWVLKKSYFPEFLPVPTQAILFLGKRSPGKKLIAFAKENKIPLVSVQKTEGFMFKKEEEVWTLLVQGNSDK